MHGIIRDKTTNSCGLVYTQHKDHKAKSLNSLCWPVNFFLFFFVSNKTTLKTA